MDSYDSLPSLLQAAPADATAIVVPETPTSISYESLRQQVMGMAESLAGAGIRPGDRVASVLPNRLATIVEFLAASVAGTAARLNSAYRYEEFCFYLEDTAARLLLVPQEGADEARRAAQHLGIPVFSVTTSAQGVASIVDAPKAASVSAPSPDDIALVLHTSGSTGRPKRVPLKHKNLAVSCGNVARTYALSPQDVSLCVMTLFHVHGLVVSTMATFLLYVTLYVRA